MPAPPPLPDPSHIEMRLLVVAQMLENAVSEVRRTMAEIKGDIRPSTDTGQKPEISGGSDA
jgi:hypothetical protein